MKRWKAVAGLVALAVFCAAGLFVGPTMAQNVSNYMEQGGARWVIGGSLDVVSGGEIDIESGGALKIAGSQVPVTWTVALAASATTDGMEVTITAKDAAGSTVAAAIPFEFWFTDATTGIGLTADAFSGTLTIPSVGAVHTALTAKKHIMGITAATGISTILIVDSANPTDVYAAVKKPLGNGVVVSAASGTSWEGAA